MHVFSVQSLNYCTVERYKADAYYITVAYEEYVYGGGAGGYHKYNVKTFLHNYILIFNNDLQIFFFLMILKIHQVQR